MAEQRPRRRLTIGLLIPSTVLLIVQGFGIWATDSQLRPIFSIPRILSLPLVMLGILLSGVSPLTSTFALVAAIKGSASRLRRVLLVLVCGFLFCN